MIVDPVIGQTPVTGAVVLRPSPPDFSDRYPYVCLRTNVQPPWTEINLMTLELLQCYLSRSRLTHVELLIRG